MFMIKFGGLYFKDYIPCIDELIYTSSVYEAMKFETLEVLDTCVARFNIEGYSIGIDD